MNKPVWISLITITILSAVILSACSLKAAGTANATEVTRRVAYLDPFQPDLIIPPTPASTIHGSRLYDAFINLYNRRDPVRMWDGSTLTGRSLAQFVLDNHIPLAWDTEDKCHGAGCSVRYCGGQTCHFEDGKPGVDPIYIDPSINSNLTELVRTLAHEIFHRQEPFGPVRDTLYEEYSAYSVEVQISGATYPKFDGYDPLVPAQLAKWFQDNNYPYTGLQSYPAVVTRWVHR